MLTICFIAALLHKFKHDYLYSIICLPATYFYLIMIMKKILVTLVAVFAITQFSFAQWTGTTDIYKTNTAGNIGIGTTTPSRKLDILSSSGVTPLAVVGPNGYMLIDNVGAGYNYYQANVLHQFQGTSNNPIMTILGGGNVGIGTTSPGAKLEVDGTPATSANLVKFFGSDSNGNLFTEIASTGTGGALLQLTGGGGSTFAIQSSGTLSGMGNNKLGFFAGSTNILTMLNSGYVGIGTTTPREALSVNGNIRSQQVKVELANWPDYVFKPAYILPSLTKVKTYIKNTSICLICHRKRKWLKTA